MFFKDCWNRKMLWFLRMECGLEKPSRVIMNLSIRIPVTTKEIAALIQLQEWEESFEYHNKTTAAAAVAAARMRNKIDSWCHHRKGYTFPMARTRRGVWERVTAVTATTPAETSDGDDGARHDHAGRPSSSFGGLFRFASMALSNVACVKGCSEVQYCLMALATAIGFLFIRQWHALALLASNNADCNTQESTMLMPLQSPQVNCVKATIRHYQVDFFLPRNVVSDTSGAGKSFALLESKDANCKHCGIGNFQRLCDHQGLS